MLRAFANSGNFVGIASAGRPLASCSAANAACSSCCRSFNASKSTERRNTSPRTSTNGGVPLAGEPLRDHRDQVDVLGDVFTDAAVTTRGGGLEHAVSIGEVDGQSVDLQLAEPVHRSARGGLCFAAHSRNSSIEKTLSRLSMRSACSCSGNPAVTIAAPTCCVGLSCPAVRGTPARSPRAGGNRRRTRRRTRRVAVAVVGAPRAVDTLGDQFGFDSRGLEIGRDIVDVAHRVIL